MKLDIWRFGCLAIDPPGGFRLGSGLGSGSGWILEVNQGSSAVEEEEEATQSLEVDVKLAEAMDFLLRFKRSEEGQAYDLFSIHNQSLYSLLMLAGCTTIMAMGSLCCFVLSVLYGHLSFFELAHFTVLVTVPILLSLVNWTVYCLARRKLNAFGALSLAAKKLLRIYQQGIFFILEALLCFHLIFKVYQGSCESDSMSLANLSCNAVANIKALPADASLCIMLLPLIYSITVRGADFVFSLGLWLMSVGCLAGCVAFADLRRRIRELEGQQSFAEPSTSIFHSSSSSTAALQYLPSLALVHSCVIIGVSANTDLTEINNSGMDALIGKPLNVEYFEQVFEEVKARNGLTTSLLHSSL
eukprot:gene5700-6284_t